MRDMPFLEDWPRWSITDIEIVDQVEFPRYYKSNIERLLYLNMAYQTLVLLEFYGDKDEELI